jgi:signal transduction histidine kinase
LSTQWRRHAARRFLPLCTCVAALLLSWRACALSPDLRINQFYHSAWTVKEGAPTDIEDLAQTSDGYLWIASMAGLVRFDGGRFERIDAIREQRLPSRSVYALWVPHSGGLWVGYAFCGASFISNGRIRNYGEREGLPAGAIRKFSQDKSGTVWVATTRSLRRFDGSQWVDVGARREAYFTNLAPGHYRFRVIAPNNDGVWNETGAAVDFDMPPAFVQTNWFLAICVTAGALVLWLLRTLRVRQMQARLRDRLEAQLLERERIAQELHDTLLQGLLSASLQLAVANSEISPCATAKPLVERVFQLLRQMIDEGRNAVRGLRTGHCDRDGLECMFAQIPQDLAADKHIKHQLIVEGTPRSLPPLIRDEVYRIGREALANAFRHSQASVIETVLEYTQDRFRIIVRDNGRGIDPEVLRSGRESHWGLSGMRERSEKIGARLKVLTAAGTGTEIALTVPCGAAFQRCASSGWVNWLARIYSRRETP